MHSSEEVLLHAAICVRIIVTLFADLVFWFRFLVPGRILLGRNPGAYRQIYQQPVSHGKRRSSFENRETLVEGLKREPQIEAHTFHTVQPSRYIEPKQ